MKCKNTLTINETLEELLFRSTKKSVIEDIKAIFEVLGKKTAAAAIKNIKAGKHDSFIRESLSSRITEIAESIIDMENI